MGRAWLYHTLSENLLECYLRTIEGNPDLVKKYYTGNAIFLDQQRLQILITLCSGLECVRFQLNYDVPYLDVDSHLHLQEQDNVSSDSSQSQTSTSSDLPLLSSAVILTSDNSKNFEPSKPMHRTPSFIEDKVMVPDIDDSLEIVRIRTKSKKSKKLKPRVPSIGSDLGFISDNSEPKSQSGSIRDKDLSTGISTLTDTFSDVQNDKEKPIPGCDQFESKHNRPFKESITDVPRESLIRDVSSTKTRELLDADLNNDKSDCEKKAEVHHKKHKHKQIPEKPTVKESSISIGNSKNSLIVNQSQFTDLVDGVAKSTELDHSRTSQQDISIYSRERDEQDMSCEIVNIENHSGSDDTTRMHNLKPREAKVVKNSLMSDDLVNSVQKSSASSKIRSENTVQSDKTKQTNLSENTKINENVSSSSAEINKRVEEHYNPGKTLQSECPLTDEKEFGEGELEVDNNLMLTLMLDIFEHEEEQFQKMYETTTGHAEGNVECVFVLLTTQAVYFLKRQPNLKYKKDGTVQFTEIDYVSLSLGSQMVQIVCTNRRKQFWLTTGSELKTRCIVEELQKIMRLSGFHLPQTNILTDATTQKIALTKWATQQCRVQVSKEDIHCFVLGYWEDKTPNSSKVRIKNHKEGVLLYKVFTIDSLGYGIWKPGYFVLSNGVLYQYDNKDDTHTPNKCIQIGGDDCGGCRRSKSSDRDHSFEIIMSNGTVLHLSASKQEEANEWLQCLCQAVSEDQQVHSNTLACCVVVTSTKILLCHEDVQTEFFRTIASANVDDMTGLAVDPSTHRYFIIEFDSQDCHIESERWVTYLCGDNEYHRLMKALDQAWSTLFQVSLPVNNISDMVLKQQCRDTVQKLKSDS